MIPCGERLFQLCMVSPDMMMKMYGSGIFYRFLGHHTMAIPKGLGYLKSIPCILKLVEFVSAKISPVLLAFPAFTTVFAFYIRRVLRKSCLFSPVQIAPVSTMAYIH